MAREHVKQQRFAGRAQFAVGGFVPGRAVPLVMRGDRRVEICAVAGSRLVRIRRVSDRVAKPSGAGFRFSMAVHRPRDFDEEPVPAPEEIRDTLTQAALERYQPPGGLFLQNLW